MDEGEAQPLRRETRPHAELGFVALGEVDEPPVVAEVGREQFRVPVEPEAPDDEGVEVADEIVGEIEARGFFLVEPFEGLEPGIEGIAVGAGDAGYPFLLEHAIEGTGRAAVGVGDEDPREARPQLVDPGPHRLRDPLWVIVQGGGQTEELDARKPGSLENGQDLARERAAGDDGDAPLRHPAHDAAPARRLWRRAMSALAVSTATAASRQ